MDIKEICMAWPEWYPEKHSSSDLMDEAQEHMHRPFSVMAGCEKSTRGSGCHLEMAQEVIDLSKRLNKSCLQKTYIL